MIFGSNKKLEKNRFEGEEKRLKQREYAAFMTLFRSH